MQSVITILQIVIGIKGFIFGFGTGRTGRGGRFVRRRKGFERRFRNGHKLFCWFGLLADVGFVRQFRTERFQALEFLEGAAILTFGLGLIAEHEAPDIGLASQAAEALAGGEVPVLRARDFDIAVTGEIFAHGPYGIAGPVENLVERGGEDAGFDAGAAEDVLLGDGHALNGEEFLRIDRAIAGDQVGLQVRDFIELFEAHDSEGRGAEAMFDGIARGARFALGRTWAGGTLRVGAIGGESFFRNRTGWHVGGYAASAVRTRILGLRATTNGERIDAR